MLKPPDVAAASSGKAGESNPRISPYIALGGGASEGLGVGVGSLGAGVSRLGTERGL